ncbi:protein rhomboid [Coccinella septempunctata]|uniref:protein rhomboid n=1 Tax=Coccinella septempunctata TaxID=41139 RepID=UPI001D083A26|nr:protein rhomboid [Coccinella septempunctata]XP_044754639.1 protein rhomboid [Coccinella septempunctata]XP_044754640.1 protein rhomboid [Coccinella septempunctata]XP_044754641.1 protein rhomboid [Coccinella septempunctata]
MRHFSLDDEPLGEKNIYISPVTTPTSTVDEEKCLVRIPLRDARLHTKDVWKYIVQNLPYFMLVISLAEAIIYFECNADIRKLLRFDPDKKYEIWRYLTYMLLHEDVVHLTLNLFLQCTFAFFLETKQGRLKVAILYLAGGVTGVLGASCINPGILIGASAGVYSLLISLVADLYLNYENIKYKAYRGICISVLVLSDITFNLYHFWSREEPVISWEAHLFGGLTGLILGLALYENTKGLQQERKNICLTFSSLLYFLIFTTLVIITIDSGASKCANKMNS